MLDDIITLLHVAGLIGCAVISHMLWSYRRFGIVRPFWLKNVWYLLIFAFLLVGDLFKVWPFNDNDMRRLLFNFAIVGATYHTIFSLLTRKE
jgi:hypothetical protein